MVFEVSGDWEDGSTDGRPDEFVWELGFLLEVPRVKSNAYGQEVESGIEFQVRISM